MAALCGCNYITLEHIYAIRYAWQPGIREVAILPSSVMDWVEAAVDNRGLECSWATLPDRRHKRRAEKCELFGPRIISER
jgi:hypothetical protein